MSKKITGIYFNAKTGHLISLERLPGSRNIWVVREGTQVCLKEPAVRSIFLSRYHRGFIFKIGDL